MHLRKLDFDILQHQMPIGPYETVSPRLSLYALAPKFQNFNKKKCILPEQFFMFCPWQSNLQYSVHGNWCPYTVRLFYTQVALRYLIGMMYVNFTMMWKPTIELIQSHASGLNTKVFWKVFEHYLDKAASKAGLWILPHSPLFELYFTLFPFSFGRRSAGCPGPILDTPFRSTLKEIRR